MQTTLQPFSIGALPSSYLQLEAQQQGSAHSFYMILYWLPALFKRSDLNSYNQFNFCEVNVFQNSNLRD
jgi:hypothetical protein